ncbi:nitrile hydratase subunit alpha [Streptomyces sp. NPDC059688]|uniref:nitrile hydratase subunit alpha n=1 Tax=Streptomyces sp. NPDC059688 TaxID=3346906 RepID=UPI00369BB662
MGRGPCSAPLRSGPLDGARKRTQPGKRARPGSKHHVVTDAQGIPLAVSLTGGNGNDVHPTPAPARQDSSSRRHRRPAHPPLNSLLRSTAHESTSEVRWLVLPEQPPGTEQLAEEAVVPLLTRDAVGGVAKVAAS